MVIDVAFPTFARLRGDRPALVAQFLQFTRLNLIAVLPFVVMILLVIPEFLTVFYGGPRSSWTTAELALCADAARILCVVGLLRALGFLGPPLLDGLGRPELTLRYMVFAAIAVPGTFMLGAAVLGDHLGLLSVAVAWAVGYPIAFAALSYLIVRTIDLPLRAYARASWGIIGCCGAGAAAGFAVRLALPVGVAPGVVIGAVGATALVVLLGLLATWQGITPRSVRRAIRGDQGPRRTISQLSRSASGPRPSRQIRPATGQEPGPMGNRPRVRHCPTGRLWTLGALALMRRDWAAAPLPDARERRYDDDRLARCPCVGPGRGRR